MQTGTFLHPLPQSRTEPKRACSTVSNLLPIRLAGPRMEASDHVDIKPRVSMIKLILVIMMMAAVIRPTTERRR